LGLRQTMKKQRSSSTCECVGGWVCGGGGQGKGAGGGGGSLQANECKDRPLGGGGWAVPEDPFGLRQTMRRHK
jgi:hypothetical protein